MKKQYRLPIFLLLLCLALAIGYFESQMPDHREEEVTGNTLITLDEIPEYTGSPYIAIKDNIPEFKDEEKGTISFEIYEDLDELGRCTLAYANIGRDLMPTEKRKSISHIKPSGWQSVQYDNVDGKSLYNRCHLIGFQLTAENANERNLITGTRYMNVEGMLPFENMVTDYIKETNNHVLYRVTPIFEGDDLVARGVVMEAYSVEDEGEGISFHVYIYNVQPGIAIDYSNGDSYLTQEVKQEDSSKEKVEIRGNSNSMIYHAPGQAAYEDMAKSKYLVIFSSEKEAESQGYRKAKR